MDAAFLAKLFGQGAVAAAILAAVLGVLAVRFAGRAAADKDATVSRVQQESAQAVAAARVRGEEASARETRTAERIATLESEAQQERQRADNAERGLRDLLKRTGPRSLSGEQVTRLIEELKPFAGTHVDVVELLDPEASPFSDQLHQAFTSAGWTVSRSRMTFMIPPRYGVICEHPDGDPAAAALMRRLRAERVAVSEMSSRTLSVVVGPRPPA